VDLNMFREDLS